MEEVLQERAGDHQRGDCAEGAEDLTAGIAFSEVSKTFRGRRGPWRPFARRADLEALHSVTLRVPPGSSVAVLGPNGSGKSTLLRLAAGVITPTAGRVCAAGRAAYVPGGDRQFYDRITGYENIRFFARMAGESPEPWAVAARELGLGSALDDPLWTYSSGMRIRLAVARVLAWPRELVLLDEPTRGLDEKGREAVRGVVQAAAASSSAVLLATHDLDLASACDRAVVLDRGRIAWEGPGRAREELRGLLSSLRSMADQPDRAHDEARG